MQTEFTWNMGKYITKYFADPQMEYVPMYTAERIFQLDPEPPVVENRNEYILSALRERDLKYFSFFLHHYEPELNKRIKQFLCITHDEFYRWYDTDRFLEFKFSCRELMLQKLMTYDPNRGAEYTTYIYPYIKDAMLRFLLAEERWSLPSLSYYKKVRYMAWLVGHSNDPIAEFSHKMNCSLDLAEEYLRTARAMHRQRSYFVTDEEGQRTGEDVSYDDHWDYVDILFEDIDAKIVRRAFEKLDYREQILLEQRLSICMTCGRVSSLKGRPTFEELAVMFEGSSASGAERAYQRALDKLTRYLTEAGAIHAIRLKRKQIENAAAIYEYQVDCDGAWGEIAIYFENGSAEIRRLADWDTVQSNRFAKQAVEYLMECGMERMPRETVIAVRK